MTDTPIESLNLPVIVYNALKRNNIHTRGDLCAMTWRDLRDIRNIGDLSVRRIEAALASVGLSLTPVKEF